MRKTVFIEIVFVLLNTLLVVGFAQAETIYVDDDNIAGPWDGTLDHPYQYIQDGIDIAAEGDTVVVLDGTYTGARNKNLDFNGKPVTVRSQNGPEYTIIDCGNNGRGFHFRSGETSASVVQGFTIRNGKAGYAGWGGGIYCYSSSPKITNNIITSSVADRGGGIACAISSSPIIQNNKISGNSASGSYPVGGGISSEDSSPVIENNEITENRANWGIS